MSYDNIKLEKGLYRTGKGFTKSLEEIDPSENYRGTELEGLDAYQRQLKRFDIKVAGTQSDKIDKFFQTTDSSALFPEYVSRAVRQGMEEADILSKLVATTTQIDSLDYRAIESVPSKNDKTLADVAEGAEIPQTTIKTKETLVSLHKRGRTLVASYEAIKFQRLDLFTVTLKQIGAYIARSQVADAINTLNDSSLTAITCGGSTLAYSDLVNLWNQFDAYDMTTIIANTTNMPSILNLTEFKDANAGLNFHGTGKLITPLGAELIKTSSCPSGKIIAIDNKCALEMVKAGDIQTDFDKLIDRQLEKAAVTSIAGFSKIFADAGKALTIS